MLSHTLLALVATVAVATPLHKLNYKIPDIMVKLLAQDDNCIMPSTFDILSLRVFAPQDTSKSFKIQLVEVSRWTVRPGRNERESCCFCNIRRRGTDYLDGQFQERGQC